MVPRNSSLRAHPADTSTGCAVCVLSSFQRTRPCDPSLPAGVPYPFRPAYCRPGCRQGNLTILRRKAGSVNPPHRISGSALADRSDLSRQQSPALFSLQSTTILSGLDIVWKRLEASGSALRRALPSAFQRPGPLILRVRSRRVNRSGEPSVSHRRATSRRRG
jgi:hypothetical protein